MSTHSTDANAKIFSDLYIGVAVHKKFYYFFIS